MNSHATRPLAALLFGLTVALMLATARAGEPASRGDEPVKKALEDFQKDVAAKFPAERLKAYEEGVEQVSRSGVLDKALKVGDKAPDFELPDGSGHLVKLSDQLKGGPVIVTWYRGGWCPYCNIALRGFQKVMPAIKEAGGSMIALSPQTPDRSAKTAADDELGFEVLSDQGNKVARAYGVAYKLPQVVVDQMKGRLDLAKANGDDSNELPLGATYLIDRQGTIRYAFVDGDYRKRAEPAHVLAALRGLGKTP